MGYLSPISLCSTSDRPLRNGCRYANDGREMQANFNQKPKTISLKKVLIEDDVSDV